MDWGDERGEECNGGRRGVSYAEDGLEEGPYWRTPH